MNTMLQLNPLKLEQFFEDQVGKKVLIGLFVLNVQISSKLAQVEKLGSYQTFAF